MAVHAHQQFLENPPLLCNDKGGNSSGVGWVDNRGGLQQRQTRITTTMTAAACSGLANQQLGATCCSYPPPSSRTQIQPESSCYLASQVDRQKREIDQFLCVQSERLTAALQRQAKRHTLSLMRVLEAKASCLLRRKEEELATARRMMAELEECLRRSEVETQEWQRVARENEAIAIALGNALQQVRDNARLPSADPAASCCSSSADPLGPGGFGGGGEPEEPSGVAVAGRCRVCGARDSRFLLLPCMHLCACKLCDSLLSSCPVCRSGKHGSIEVFMS